MSMPTTFATKAGELLSLWISRLLSCLCFCSCCIHGMCICRASRSYSVPIQSGWARSIRCRMHGLHPVLLPFQGRGESARCDGAAGVRRPVVLRAVGYHGNRPRHRPWYRRHGAQAYHPYGRAQRDAAWVFDGGRRTGCVSHYLLLTYCRTRDERKRIPA